MAFTEAQIATAISAVGVFAPEDIGPLATYLYAAYGSQRQAVVTAHYDALVAQIRGYASQEILDRAAALADNAADSLLRTIAESDLKTIGERIAQGIAEGLNSKDIARRLEEVQGLDSVRASAFEKFRDSLDATNMTDAQIAAAEEREFQRLLRARRETIARTEGATAVSQGDKLEAVRGGARYKVWQTTGDDRVSDECEANEAQGPIPIDEAFASGADTVPAHPNCRCAVSYVTDPELLPTVEAISADAAKRTAQAKGE